MPATLILSQRIEIGTRQTASIDVPAPARRCNVRGVLSEADATSPLSHANLFVEFWDGVAWTHAASVDGWQGAPPRFPDAPAGRPGVDGLGWAVANPPKKIRATLDTTTGVLMGCEIEFFDAAGAPL